MGLGGITLQTCDIPSLETIGERTTMASSGGMGGCSGCGRLGGRRGG